MSDSECSEESFGNGVDLYWNGKGKYKKELERLQEKYVPPRGEALTLHGELIRRLLNIQHQLMNNGCKEQASSYTLAQDPLPTEWKGKLVEIPDTVAEFLDGDFYGDMDDAIDDAVEYALRCEKNDSKEVKEKCRELKRKKKEQKMLWKEYELMEEYVEPIKDAVQKLDFTLMKKLLTKKAVDKIISFSSPYVESYSLQARITTALTKVDKKADEKHVFYTCMLLRDKGLLSIEPINRWEFCLFIEKFPIVLPFYPQYVYEYRQYAMTHEEILRAIVKYRVPVSSLALVHLCKKENLVGIKYLPKILSFSSTDMMTEECVFWSVANALSGSESKLHQKRIVKLFVKHGLITKSNWRKVKSYVGEQKNENGNWMKTLDDLTRDALRKDDLFWAEKWSRPGGVLYEKAQASFVESSVL
jgi:hypothetical protein